MAAYGAKTRINLDLFTDAYRVTGSVMVGAGGIHAALSNPNTKFLELENAYISRIHESGDIVANYPVAAFRKENITFIVLQDRREGIPVGTQHGRSVFTRGREAYAFLTVPSFEIRGQVLYDGKASARDVLVQSMGQFQLIFDATATASFVPEVQYSGDLILAHKEQIGIFCLSSVKS